MQEDKEEFDEEEYEKSVKEYEQSEYDDDFEELNTGIVALDRTYSFDKRVEKLVDFFNNAISFMENYTELSREEIINRINSKILEIELVDGYEDNPHGIGYVDNIFNLLSINEKKLEENPKIIYAFIKHEMTHMLSGEFVKKFWQKRPILFSGYSREDVYNFDTEEPIIENKYFDEAVVEMFIYQEEPYRQEKFFEYVVYTNQDFNEGFYAINSNIIRQMMLARGIDKKTLFKGLYDKDTARFVEKSFNKRIFTQLSQNMNDISIGILDYWDLDNLKESEQYNQELEWKIKQKENSILDKIKESERMIIDSILIPRLKTVSQEKREELLSEYQKYLVCENEYFKYKTGYQAITAKKAKKSNKPWLEKVDVDINEVIEKHEKANDEEKGNEISKE